MTWTQSEPPRGSGWVQAQRASCYPNPFGCAPTRYREVVLTVPKQSLWTNKKDAWTESVPPAVAGGYVVDRARIRDALAPTRYREVVLTVSN